MGKVTRQIRFSEQLWGDIVEKAQTSGLSPNNLVVFILSNYMNGALNLTKIGSTPVKSTKKEELKPVKQKDCVEAPPSDWLTNPTSLRIKELQDLIAQEQFNLDGYLEARFPDPETGELTLEDDPDAWYIVESRQKLEALQEELHSIMPHYKEDADELGV